LRHHNLKQLALPTLIVNLVVQYKKVQQAVDRAILVILGPIVFRNSRLRNDDDRNQSVPQTHWKNDFNKPFVRFCWVIE